jgi:hypothetical protein
VAGLSVYAQEIVEVNHFFTKPNHVHVHLNYDEFMALHVETLTCMTLALLYDDTKNNNFDCPWDWRNQKNLRVI